MRSSVLTRLSLLSFAIAGWAACSSDTGSGPGPELETPIHEALTQTSGAFGFFNIQAVGDQWLVGRAQLDAKNNSALFSIDRGTSETRFLEENATKYFTTATAVVSLGRTDVVVLNDLASQARRELSAPGHAVRSFWLSDNGSFVTYLADVDSGRELFAVPTAGGTPVQVSDVSNDGAVIAELSTTYGRFATIPRVAGDRVIYASELDEEDDRWELISIRTDGTGRIRLNQDLGEDGTVSAARGTDGYTFSVSPDESQVAYVSTEESVGGGEVFLIAPDGTGRERVHAPVEASGGFGQSFSFRQLVADFLADGSLLFSLDTDGTGSRLFHRPTGGPAQRLADGAVVSVSHIPEAIPGTASIVMVTSEGLVRAPLDGGTPELLVSASEAGDIKGRINRPRVTSDGAHVVFFSTSSGEGQLYARGLGSGGTLTRLDRVPTTGAGIPDNGVSAASFFLSADGQSAVYRTVLAEAGMTAFWVALDGSGDKAVSPEPEAGSPRPDVSLEFFDRQAIFTHDTLLDGERLLYAYDPARDETDAPGDGFPTFVLEDVQNVVASHTSSALMATAGTSFSRTPKLLVRGASGGTLCEVPFPGSASAQLTIFTPSNGQISSIDVGYFRYRIDAESPFLLYRADLEGCTARPLVDTENVSSMGGLSVSDDGQTIAFAMSREGESTSTLYACDQDGSNLRALSDPDTEGRSESSNDGNVLFTPNGERAIYLTREGIYSVGLDGTGRVRLDQEMTPEPPFSGGRLRVDFLGDGSELVFVTGTNARNAKPWIVPADGSAVPRLIDLPENTSLNLLTSQPTAIQVTESGRLVLHLRGNDGSRSLVSTAADGTGLVELDGGAPNGPVVVGDQVLYEQVLEDGSELWLSGTDGASPPVRLHALPDRTQRFFYFPTPDAAGNILYVVRNRPVSELWQASLSDGSTQMLGEITDFFSGSSTSIAVSATHAAFRSEDPTSTFGELYLLDRATAELTVALSGESGGRTLRSLQLIDGAASLLYVGDFRERGVFEVFELPVN